MNNYQLKYGFLSNYKTYIFVRRVEDYRYHVSPPISSKQKSPTLRECFTYINYLTGGRSYQYKSDCDWDTIVSQYRYRACLRNSLTSDTDSKLPRKHDYRLPPLLRPNGQTKHPPPPKSSLTDSTETLPQTNPKTEPQSSTYPSKIQHQKTRFRRRSSRNPRHSAGYA